MRENPVISDRVPRRGDLSEGSLGGRLAQRLAALREVMAAGARLFACLPSCSSALAVPRCAGKGEEECKEQGRNSKSKSSAAFQNRAPLQKRKEPNATDSAWLF